ncbi:gastric triacylglycerol lipase-like isoform X2 [Leptinotarsa decemlineata]|uniref:gastric triacylglycerol lipase-like isoform X2 n=1 Tax=Leptinotarsa decemlineata TaxID=7539 RepID=UPI003D30A10E
MQKISLAIITFGMSFFSLKFTLTKTLIACDEFKYLYQKNNEDHCFNNPNGEYNTTEIVRKWEGYTAEEYNIYTEDGYQILIIRAYSKISQKTPIAIGHGLSQNSSGLVLRDDKSITKFLGDHGYDIWMINFRGTSESLGHVNKSADNLDYWTFSFHELGYYDIPAVLDLIIRTTNQKPIYLGISLGSTASYVFGSARPDMAKEKLKGIISYAPVGYMKNIKSYVKFLAPFQPILEPILRQVFKGAIRSSGFMESFCTKFPFQIYICETVKMVFFGDRYAQIDTIDAPILLQLQDNVPVGILAHFAQLINSGELRHRSFGGSENIKRYGQPVPPNYDVSKIPVPVSLVVGANDWLGTLDGFVTLHTKNWPIELIKMFGFLQKRGNLGWT